MSRKNATKTAPKAAVSESSARRKTTTPRKAAVKKSAPVIAATEETFSAEVVSLPVTEVVVSAPVEPVVESAPPTPSPRVVERNEWEPVVRKEAYLLAEQRAFRNGNPFEDWIRAEAAVRTRFESEGATVR